MNGNYERLLSGELFPGDEPSVEEVETMARLDNEAQQYHEELLE